MNAINAILKRLNIDTGGTVAGFLPDPLAAEFIDYVNDINILRRVVNVFKMNSRKITYPVISGQMAAYFASDGETAQLQDFSTTQLSFEAKKLMAQVLVDEEVYEDSVAGMRPIVMRQFAQAIANAEETALAIGDTGLSHTATSIAAATAGNLFTGDPRAGGWDGIWTLASAADAGTPVNAGGANLSHTHINSALFNLGKYARNKRNCVLLVDDFQASNLRINSDLKQVMITGMNRSPIIDGELTVIHGVSVVEVPSGETTESILMYRPYAQLGDRRLIRVRDDDEIASDQKRMVVSERLDFKYADNAGLVRIDSLSSPSASSS